MGIRTLFDSGSGEAAFEDEKRLSPPLRQKHKGPVRGLSFLSERGWEFEPCSTNAAAQQVQLNPILSAKTTGCRCPFCFPGFVGLIDRLVGAPQSFQAAGRIGPNQAKL